MREKNSLSIGELRAVCDPAQFKFKNTTELVPLDEVIGQARAVTAIQFGLNMKGQGYNIFVTGLEGTGKQTIVRDIVTQFAATQNTPPDWCMVNNFKDEFRPQPLKLPAGKAQQFAKTMNKLIKSLQIRLSKKFQNKSFQGKILGIQQKSDQQQQVLVERLNQLANQKNLQITKTASGYHPLPMIDNRALSPEELDKLPKEQKRQFESAMRDIQAEMQSTQAEINKLNQAQNKAMDELIEDLANHVVGARIDALRAEYKDNREIQAYLGHLQSSIVEDLDTFITSENAEDDADESQKEDEKPSFDRYKVNILADRKNCKGAPVVFEANPSHKNLFGQIEKRWPMENQATDFTMVKAGSMLQANGGYLIMEMDAVLMNPYVWEAIKRALQTKMLCIEDMPSEMGPVSASLRPDPIPLDVKIILLGEYGIFEQVQSEDLKFNKYFRVRADFDYETVRNPQAVQLYARFIARVCKQEGLLPFTRDGVAAIVEFSQKVVAHQQKLSLRFGPIVSIIKEADYWARQLNKKQVHDQHVFKAFSEHRFRHNLYEEKIHESYVDNTIMIDVENDVVGQINGLAIFQVGELAFGRPTRITAETFMGPSGIINIEREADMSGSTYDKGVMVLSGYLGRTFAQHNPLCLSISLAFEQNYNGVDGDSASSTELYAILSSLSDLLIHQGIAVTGSVNQKGEIQAIGGVNQKIEGFYEVCQSKGLTGKQGVIIPAANLKNLMIKREILTAVEKGQFHIYQVNTVQEGIEILTGVPAGSPDETGQYPEGTVFGRVQKKLEKFLDHSLKLKETALF